MSGLLKLVTGKKGSGKSLWVVDQLFKEFDKGIFEHYYSDITNLKHTGVESAPEDWTDVEDNSLIIYDEVQFKLLFSRFNSKRDKQILELTTMRKRGIEMWIITQQARALNADVIGLVDEHVHIERNGDKTSKVYVFQDAKMQIRKTDKMFPFDKYVFAHPQHLYGFYESVKENANHVKRSWLNKGVITTGITLALVVLFGGTFIYNGFKDGMKIQDVNEKPTTATNQKPVANNLTEQSKPTEAVSSASDLSAICRQAVNVDKPECVKWYDDLTKSKSSFNQDGTIVQAVSYNPEKPFDNVDIQKTISYQVTAKPKFSGCTKFNGNYVAYTQQGTKLNVSASDCVRLIDQNDRPFDFFRQSDITSNSDNAIVSNSNSNDITYNSANDSSRLNYANNEIQSGLERKVINGSNAL